MCLQNYRKTIIVVLVTMAFASRTLCRYIAWKNKKKNNANAINEVITFSEAEHLVPSKYSLLGSNVPPSMERILDYLNRSRHTLDICMYMLSNRDIAYMIQKIHYRGVKIRYIVDADTAFINGSETKRLSKQDIVILRWMKSSKNNLMHHKFCLIDASADIKDKKVTPFVMTGSLNWTNPALSGNWESVVVMSHQKIVRGYKEEFEKLWLQFAPPCPHLATL